MAICKGKNVREKLFLAFFSHIHTLHTVYRGAPPNVYTPAYEKYMYKILLINLYKHRRELKSCLNYAITLSVQSGHH